MESCEAYTNSLTLRIDKSNDLRRKCLGEFGISEMERDAMLAHGVSRFLKERLFDQSDPYQISVCNKCGSICSPTECQTCETDQVSRCNFPYAAKLVIQELQAMSIRTSIRPKIDNA